MTKTAVITGATSGMGAAYAKRLSADGYDLILVGRRKEIIQRLARDLAAQNHVKVQAVIAELSDDDDLQKVISAIKSVNNVEVLINNAGYYIRRTFDEMDVSDCEKMVRVHELAPMRLISTVIQNMIKAGKGTIINVSSAAAYLPQYGGSIYVGTKAFLILFTESLHMELRDKGIKVQVLCPSFVDTDFYRFTTAEIKNKLISRDPRKWSPEAVVDFSLKSLKKNQSICIPGYGYKAMYGLMSILPRNTVYNISKRLFEF